MVPDEGLELSTFRLQGGKIRHLISFHVVSNYTTISIYPIKLSSINTFKPFILFHLVSLSCYNNYQHNYQQFVFFAYMGEKLDVDR